ncbi:LysR family transcriptional regulator [Chromobacterium sp. IIBBL 290-4]|uniref:LysR family transcriptional regulator n=1 Tax=Chromobacterium sp. IIBBL 290-4 TaxID=2953890 RepID=UPI0020B6FBE4|nr:LysR family transcriptional regulator [Chromobacterium sp. IIBBL 290-4]UTH74678.1 LysR family transcriptional regulator [Chromobacterium sp. IIBBL 290-4]
MTTPDLNLLIVLDALLAEGSVARAARRLRLSPSAMSRALARLRQTTGDPLLVRAGRGLTPTPRAQALREQVGPLLRAALAALGPPPALDLAALQRTFTLRATDGFAENFGPRLIARLHAEAPGARLRFVLKLDKDSEPLRKGEVDLETGVIGHTAGPELRARALFRDRFVGVVRPSHPLAEGEVTAESFAAGRHILVARREQGESRVDRALTLLGLQRDIAVTVSGFSAALALARADELIAVVPSRHTGYLLDGLVSFPLPLDVPEITVSMLWHPRMDADPAHQWLRNTLKQVCDEACPARPAR